MAFAAPVSIAPAGSGGVLTGTGGMTGVEGLFAALLGMGGGGVMTGQVTTLAMPGASDADSGADAQPNAATMMQTLLKVGADTQVEVQGDSQTVTAFAQQVQSLYQQVIASGQLTVGGDDATKDLAAALVKMGVPAEKAGGMAEQIETMLKLVEQQQGEPLSDDEKSSLTALMLAGMLPNAQGQAFDVQISAKETQATVSVVQVDNAFTKGKTPSPADVLRQLTAMGADGSTDTKVAIDAGADDKAKTPDMPVKKDPQAAAFKIDVTHNDDGAATVTVTLTDAQPATHVAKTAVDAVAVNVNAEAATQNAAFTPNVERVSNDRLQDKVRGETVYKLQADKNGVETLQAVRPVDNSAAAALATQGQQTTAAPQGTTQNGDGMAFAERLALAQRNHVDQQVALQMKPLLDNGGGHVRMTLNPPELGRISIDLQVSEGKVHGSIAATDPAVVEQLARELHNLRHGLADAGLKLGDQGINLMLSNSNQFAQGQGQQGGRGNTPTARGGFDGADDLAGVDAVADAAAWVAPDRVLDMKV